jgi:hypothetical protein
MKLAGDDALGRLSTHDHGVLCTLHPERGVDAVPVVFAVPIDRVKPKASARLQREHNLQADARATLLVDHWDRDDWTQLWWVRAELHWQPDPSPEANEALAAGLAARYPQYEDRPFDRLLVFRIVGLTGWAAA